MTYDVSVKEMPPVDVICVSITTPRASVGPAIQDAYQRIFNGIEREKITPVGPPRLVYQHMTDDPWKLEACVPIAGADHAPEGLTMRRFDGGRVVSTLHVGPYEEMGRAYEALQIWVDEHGLDFAGAPYDIYISDPAEVPPAKLETEIVWPVR